MSNSDNVYLNIIVNNPDNFSSPNPVNIPAIYDESLTIGVLQNPSDYYLSIIRFSLPLDLIPILVFPLNTMQNNPNVSNLLIGVNGFYQPVVYLPQEIGIIAPAPSGVAPFFTAQQSQSQYYFIYSIQSFVTMINNALSAAFVAAGSPGGGTAPYYIFTSTTQLLSLIVTSAFIAAGTISLNAGLKNYLHAFRYTTLDNNAGPYLFTHDLSVTPYGQVSPFKFDQEYNSINLWFDIRKIVITSSSLPVTPEASPVSLPTTGSNNTAGVTSYLPIVTDFIVSYDNIADISTVLVYNPTAQYRLVDMNSNVPINRLNLSFYWQSENANLYPIYLSPGQAITVKIAFFKKSLYKF